MKNVITNTKKGFLMVTMFYTLLSFANDASSFIIKNDAKRTSLTLENVKEGNLLSIKDNNSIILYKERIQHTGIYSKGFDLTELPDGSYIFELDGDTEIKTIPFTVTSNNVVFKKELETKTFKPFVKVEEDIVYITKLALNNEPLQINIYFENKNFSSTPELVHSETIKGIKKIEKVFKLSRYEKGAYKIVFLTNGRKYTKIIK